MESMATNHYGTRGIVYTTMPIPPIAENCFEIPAGPVKFVLESRLLNAEIISDHQAKYGSNLGESLEEDGRASLHGADLVYICLTSLPLGIQTVKLLFQTILGRFVVTKEGERFYEQ
jgi:hypothetical protein